MAGMLHSSDALPLTINAARIRPYKSQPLPTTCSSASLKHPFRKFDYRHGPGGSREGAWQRGWGEERRGEEHVSGGGWWLGTEWEAGKKEEEGGGVPEGQQPAVPTTHGAPVCEL